MASQRFGEALVDILQFAQSAAAHFCQFETGYKEHAVSRKSHPQVRATGSVPYTLSWLLLCFMRHPGGKATIYIGQMKRSRSKRCERIHDAFLRCAHGAAGAWRQIIFSGEMEHAVDDVQHEFPGGTAAVGVGVVNGDSGTDVEFRR